MKIPTGCPADSQGPGGAPGPCVRFFVSLTPPAVFILPLVRFGLRVPPAIGKRNDGPGPTVAGATGVMPPGGGAGGDGATPFAASFVAVAVLGTSLVSPSASTSRVVNTVVVPALPSDLFFLNVFATADAVANALPSFASSGLFSALAPFLVSFMLAPVTV